MTTIVLLGVAVSGRIGVNGQSELMPFEEGIDDFFRQLKRQLKKQTGIQIKLLGLPQCLSGCCVFLDGKPFHLRFVVLGMKNHAYVGRLSWITAHGREVTCCYMNHTFEAIALRPDGRLRCLRQSVVDLCIASLGTLFETDMQKG